jgi:hypothetical protein
MSCVDKTHIIKYHDDLVEHNLVPDKTRKVINIDFHNDIVIDDGGSLNEGTWGNYLPKSVKEFEWRYPDHYECVRRGRGRCTPAGRIRDYPITYIQKRGIEDIDMRNINAVVICLSPNWDHMQLLPDFVSMLGLCPLDEVDDYIRYIKRYRSVCSGS